MRLDQNMKRKQKRTARNAIQILTNPALRNHPHDTGFGKARQSLAALDESSMPPTKGNR